MARILFIGEAVTLSHMVRPMVLAKAMHARGHTVAFACDTRFRSLAADLPFHFIPLHSAIPAEGFAQLLKKGEPMYSPETLDRYVHEDRKMIRATRPDVVVGDMRQSLAVSGPLAKVPTVNIIDSHWSPHGDEPFELPDHPLMGVIGEGLSRSLFQLLTPVGSALYAFPLNAVRMKHGLPPLGIDMKRIFCWGDHVVYPGVPELPPLRDLPSNHHHIGPILWSPDVPKPDWWDRVPTDRPIVYVSLGSSGEQGMLDMILGALADLPVSVMAATTKYGRVDNPPPNAFVAEYLPGTEAAARASLVVCSGGTMPSYQPLAAGVPIVALPSNMDQLMFAKVLARAGAGEYLEERKVTGAAVRAMAERVLSTPSYREAAGRIAASYAAYDPAERFAAVIDGVLAERETVAG